LSDNNGISADEASRIVTTDLPLCEMAADGDVAEAVDFLASDGARRVTSQTLFVNAGEYMHSVAPRRST
jgi:hypothetical protein